MATPRALRALDPLGASVHNRDGKEGTMLKWALVGGIIAGLIAVLVLWVWGKAGLWAWRKMQRKVAPTAFHPPEDGASS